MNETPTCKNQQSNKTSSRSVEPLKILGLRSREDLIEEWLALNPKDVTDVDEMGLKKSLPK